MRYREIDILKGIAVVCMVIYHFFYFPNQYGFKEIKYDTPFLKTIAKIAQFIPMNKANHHFMGPDRPNGRP